MKKNLRKDILAREKEYWRKVREAAKKNTARICHK
jgi:hypothetical protein